jgi:hypothetical protein
LVRESKKKNVILVKDKRKFLYPRKSKLEINGGDKEMTGNLAEMCLSYFDVLAASLKSLG